MNEDLSLLKCHAFAGGEKALTLIEALELQEKAPDWQIKESHSKLTNDYSFKNFKQALAFVNEVGKVAEEQGHHPDISFGWGYVKLIFTTHDAKGLTINDFIMAAKIDKLPR